MSLSTLDRSKLQTDEKLVEDEYLGEAAASYLRQMKLAKQYIEFVEKNPRLDKQSIPEWKRLLRAIDVENGKQMYCFTAFKSFREKLSADEFSELRMLILFYERHWLIDLIGRLRDKIRELEELRREA